jgi:hypothetical protein
MTSALAGLSTGTFVLVVVGAAVVLSIVAGFVGRWALRRGLREPLVVRLINRASERVVDVIRRPITIAVLDEVADVLQTGHYTRNIASALEENRTEIKDMVAEKIKTDPTTRRIGLVPFHDRIIDTASEATLRVILEVLADPRTDELVSDLLRENIRQIRAAVRARQNEGVAKDSGPAAAAIAQDRASRSPSVAR